MQRSADLAPTLRETSIERAHLRVGPRGRACGIAVLGAIYGIAAYASVGLIHRPSASPHHAAYMLLGALNMVVLPLLVVAAVAGIRRLWLDGAPNPRLSRLIMAPLWAAFILSLLTVPLWVGMANVERHASVAPGYSPTFLVAPWGFMLAYGLSLFVACAMFDFTLPFATEPQPESTPARLG